MAGGPSTLQVKPEEKLEVKQNHRAFWKRPENILALVAILFAIVQFIDARVQEQRVTRIGDNVTEVSKGVSTRFIGLFPKNMDEITRIVKQADNHLDVMADFAAYGAYTNPDGFDAYFKAMKDVLARHNGDKRPEIRMIIYDPEEAKRSTNSQFGLSEQDKAKELAKFNKEKESEVFKQFFQRHQPPGGTPTTPETFKAALAYYQEDYKRQMCDAGIQIRSVSRDLLFFLWLEDNEEAAFSFHDKGQQRELSMRSVDGNLISPMHEIFINTWNDDATPLPNCHAEKRHPDTNNAR